MKAFVTGGTGLLGGNLVRALLAEGHSVKALARSQEKAERYLGDTEAEVVLGDLAEIDGWSSHLEGCDTVFHTAAYFREYYSPGDHWPTMKRLNVDATLELCRASAEKGVSCFVHTSSEGVLAKRADGTPSDESDPYSEFAKTNLYFKSKVLCEQELCSLLDGLDMKVVLVLPGWMLGPGDAAPTGSGQFVLDLLKKKLPALTRGATSTVDARDVAAGMIKVAQNGKHGERYLLAGRYTTLRQVAETVAQLSGVSAPRITLPDPLVLLYAYLCEFWARLSGRPTVVTVDGVKTLNERKAVSSAKAEEELGVSFRPLLETVSDEIAWFQRTGWV